MFPLGRLARRGEIYRSRRYPDVKDPCLVRLGQTWHVFGTGCGLPGGLEIMHWTAPALDGPWREHGPARLIGADVVRNPAAPGVIAEGSRLHLYLQHDFNILGGHIEHLISDDHGRTFVRHGTVLESLAGTYEAGVYDPEPAEIGGRRYLTYAAMSVVGQPDLFLARSVTGSWAGPFERCGRILGQHEVDCHNQIDDDDYEWGLEGPQLLELPDGRVLLTAVCFMAGYPKGSRQRVLQAIADDPTGPYELVGPVVEPATATGENGHGTAVIHHNALHLVYQERGGEGQRWHIRRASVALGKERAASKALATLKPASDSATEPAA